MADETYAESIRQWRKEYAQRRLSPDGWLAITGLFWLEQGENRMGSDPSNQVILPSGSAPAFAGIFSLRESEITLQAAEGVEMAINDQLVTTTPIIITEDGSSEWVLLNELKISVIQRGSRYGVRVYDQNHPALKMPIDLRWYPVKEEFRIQARFVPLDQPYTISIVNVMGDFLEEPCTGYAEFTAQGETCRLYALPIEDSGRLWFLFQDATGSHTTYPGGRFLTSDGPQEGQIVLDFNKAYNPPCAYTDFATCPLPPAVNRLPIPVEAGEMKFRKPTGEPFLS